MTDDDDDGTARDNGRQATATKDRTTKDRTTGTERRPFPSLRREAAAYADGHDRPLGGYAALMGGYGAVVAAALLAGRLTRRAAVPRSSPWDLLLTAAATHKLSRLITKDAVTSPLRAPFARYEEPAGPAETNEGVRGTGLRKAVGELVTCPFCVDLWVATGLTAGRSLAPTLTRTVVSTLATITGADFLQYAYAAAERTG